jgi:hypothetical protein
MDKYVLFYRRARVLLSNAVVERLNAPHFFTDHAAIEARERRAIALVYLGEVLSKLNRGASLTSLWALPKPRLSPKVPQ